MSGNERDKKILCRIRKYCLEIEHYFDLPNKKTVQITCLPMTNLDEEQN